METLLGLGGVAALLFGGFMVAVGFTATDIQLGLGGRGSSVLAPPHHGVQRLDL